MQYNEDSDFIIIYEDRTLEFAKTLNQNIGGNLVLLPALPNTQAGKMYVDEVVGELIQNRLVTVIILIDRVAFEYSQEFFKQFVTTANRIQKPILFCPVTRSLKPIETWAKGGYFWINVHEIEKIESAISELRARIPGYVIEPTLLQDVKQVLKNEYIKEICEADQFYFDLLKTKWEEFESLDLNNTSKIREHLLHEFPNENFTAPEIEVQFKLGFSDLLEDFSGSKLTFQEYFKKLKAGPKYYTFKLIGEIIAYFDEKGYNKSEWNQYKNFRTVARSSVTQTNWVKNLFRYKIFGLNETSDSIYNAISFIKAPSENLTMLSENHRKRVAENILKTVYSHETFTASVFRLFSKHINVKNKENIGIIISEILYSARIKDGWGYIEEPEEDQENIEQGNSTTQDSTTSEEPLPLPEEWAISENGEPAIGADRMAIIMSNLIVKLKENDKGKMVGVFGNWGRGKTFLMDLIWENLEKKGSFSKVKFHAWKFQDTPASWAYLYEAFAKEYFKIDETKNAFSNEINNFLKLIELNYTRIGIKPILKILFFICISILGYKITKDVNQIFRLFVFFGGISAAGLEIISLLKKSFSKEAKEIFKKYYTKTSFANLLGTQAEIQKELKCLLKTWIKEKNKTINGKIILIVDDIDRCNEERIISIIDSLRVMLEDDEISKRVIVISAIDERVLKRAIKWKYHDLIIKDSEIDDNGRHIATRAIVNEYMDKLFITGINLGSLNYIERKAILSKYVGKERIYKRPVAVLNKEESFQNNSSVNPTKKTIEEDYKIKTTRGIFSANVNDSKREKLDSSQKIDESKFDLLEEENETLSDLLAYNDNLTPRQIRIFYYRYLLARNILKDRLIQSGSRPTQLLLKNLARFIMHYTIKGDLRLIGNNKLELQGEAGVGTSFTVFESKEVFSTKELILIHEVLEMVIAY